MNQQQVLKLLTLTLLLPFSLWSQLTIQIDFLPHNTPNGNSIFIASSFNDWQTNNDNYRLYETNEGLLQTVLNIPAGEYDFKFTRGSWATVEGTSSGAVRPNRTITYNGGEQTIHCVIDGWEDMPNSSTAAYNVHILDHFYIPQLNRHRKIWIYLPPDYYRTQYEYPVIYMHDAQNLFDENSSFGQEWAVDESMNNLFGQENNKAIIVAIENGNEHRLPEYTPWPNPNYGGGDGEAYIDFIVETLKPFIDHQYRSIPQHTGIIGSSLGGLISLYAGIRYPDVFSKVGVMSPSLWFTEDIYDFVRNSEPHFSQKIVLLAGRQESSSMISDIERMYQTLLDIGFDTHQLLLAIHDDGEHSEWYWRREFPNVYSWLFSYVTPLKSSSPLQNISYYPNPTSDIITLDRLPASSLPWEFSCYNSSGHTALSGTVNNAQIDLSSLSAGKYFIIISNRNDWGLFFIIKH